jgi:hypothetical protein
VLDRAARPRRVVAIGTAAAAALLPVLMSTAASAQSNVHYVAAAARASRCRRSGTLVAYPAAVR